MVALRNLAVYNSAMEKHDYAFHGTISSSGNLDVIINFTDKKPISSSMQKKVLAKVIDGAYHKMLNDGTIRLMSATDVAKMYGNSRQFWEKLISDGKIPYYQTSSGKITTNLWIEGYIDKSSNNTYPRENLEMRNRVVENEKKPNSKPIVPCVRCDQPFDYNYNQGLNINGICRHCGFKLRTVK